MFSVQCSGAPPRAGIATIQKLDAKLNELDLQGLRKKITKRLMQQPRKNDSNIQRILHSCTLAGECRDVLVDAKQSLIGLEPGASALAFAR